jgi:hypothetical protein
MKSVGGPNEVKSRGGGKAHEIRKDLADEVIAPLLRRTAGVAQRLEELPGFHSSKWQIIRIRAESRQEDARRSGTGGPLNDYLDFFHRRLARSTRSTFSRMHILFREVERVAQGAPLDHEEQALLHEVTARLAELESNADDIDFLRHATLAVAELKAALGQLDQVVARNIQTGR